MLQRRAKLCRQKITTMDAQLELCLEEESDSFIDVQECNLNNDIVPSPTDQGYLVDSSATLNSSATDDEQEAGEQSSPTTRLRNQFYADTFDDARRPSAGHRLKVSCSYPPCYRYRCLCVSMWEEFCSFFFQKDSFF